MKKREPNSIEAAVTRAKGILGADALSELLGCSASMVYKLSDEQHAKSLTLASAIKIDLATLQENGSSPLFDFYSAQITNAHREHTAKLDTQILSITKNVGDLAGKFNDFTAKTSEGGAGITLNERAALEAPLNEIIEKAQGLKCGLGANIKKIGGANAK